MDKVTVREKLDQIQMRVERIQELMPDDFPSLEEDRNTHELITFSFCLAVQETVDVALQFSEKGKRPKTMKESLLNLRNNKIIPEELAEVLGKACGIRNVAVHAYSRLELDKLYEACTKHLDAFQSFVVHIQDHIKALECDAQQ